MTDSANSTRPEASAIAAAFSATPSDVIAANAAHVEARRERNRRRRELQAQGKPLPPELQTKRRTPRRHQSLDRRLSAALTRAGVTPRIKSELDLLIAARIPVYAVRYWIATRHALDLPEGSILSYRTQARADIRRAANAIAEHVRHDQTIAAAVWRAETGENLNDGILSAIAEIPFPATDNENA